MRSSKESLRVCARCGVVFSSSIAKKCPACGEWIGQAAEIFDL